MEDYNWLQEIVLDLIENMLKQIKEERRTSYYTRKLSAIHEEVMAQFNKEDLGSSLKKHYSKLENEKSNVRNSEITIPKPKTMDTLLLNDMRKLKESLTPMKRELENIEEESGKRFKYKSSLTDDIVIRKSRLERDIEELRKANEAETEAKLKEKIILNKVLLIKVENIDVNIQSERSVSAFQKRKEYNEQIRHRNKSLSKKDKKHA